MKLSVNTLYLLEACVGGWHDNVTVPPTGGWRDGHAHNNKGRSHRMAWCRTEGGEAEETERKNVCVSACVCLTQCMLGLTPGLRGQMGRSRACMWVHMSISWSRNCETSLKNRLRRGVWNEQRWHVLPGAERKTSQVGCERSPHQRSVMYAKLRRYEGRTKGVGLV